MTKNIIIYASLIMSAFVFNIFYYAWFSWFLLVVIVCIPILSLAVSLPFMIISAIGGFKIFSENSIYKDDEIKIGITGNRLNKFFCPLVKINFRLTNSFASVRKKQKFLYSGVFNKPVFVNIKKFGSNCGCVQADARWCKIYDFTGIFFIPVKINCLCNTIVLPKPQKPDVLPELENLMVYGYKPKPGGGFSDIYELRKFQNGDSLKNIHWKLSSKQDDLIVREPSVPISRQLAVKLCFVNSSDYNDSILERFAFVCRHLVRHGIDCFVKTESNNFTSQIKSEKDLELYFASLYQNTNFNNCQLDTDSAIYYSIGADYEEVSGS